jgi:hypothetical protein
MAFNNLNIRNLVNRRNPLNRGLMAWWMVVPNWRGGGVFRDLLGVNHGTLMNMDPATDWIGTTRRGGWGELDFDGTNDFIDCGNVLNPGSNSMTIGFWMRSTTGPSATIRRVLQKRGTGTFGTVAGWQLSYGNAFGGGWDNSGFDDGTNYVRLNDGSDYGVFDGEPHHLFVTWDAPNNAIDLFVDGIDQGVTTLTDGAVGSIGGTRNLTMGCAWNSAGTQSQFYRGGLDDVRIWFRLLSAAERSMVYEDSLRGYPATLNRLRSPRGMATVFSAALLSHLEQHGLYVGSQT